MYDGSNRLVYALSRKDLKSVDIDNVNLPVKFNRFKMVFKVLFSSSNRRLVDWSCRIYSTVRRSTPDFCT